jgi:type II secretion system protein H
MCFITTQKDKPYEQRKTVMLINVRGFTLIELMIVVTIITVVGGIATPSLLSQLPDYRLKGTTRTVFATLQYAKMSAASAGKEYRVQFLLDPAPQRYQLQQGNSFSGSDNWKNVHYSTAIPPQVWIDHATDYRGTHQSGISTIAFNPTGTASSGGIYLENSRGSLRSVKVSSTTGRIRITTNW